MRPCWADLHVHTVLSPCADVEMIPPLIVRRALELGLEAIGITDHNRCENARSVMQAAEGTGLQVFPGMELQTVEEVHLLCLFATWEQAAEWQEVVERKLLPLRNWEERLGPQYVVDATGELMRTEERLLIQSAQIPLDEAVGQVQERGGLAIPAHVDREAFGLFMNLGFLPEALDVDALEVSRHFKRMSDQRKWPGMEGRTLIMNGDAHNLNEMSKRTCYQVEEASLAEIRRALRRENGRNVEIIDHNNLIG